jgi:secretion/DNA translocation related TadE-like protein
MKDRGAASIYVATVGLMLALAGLGIAVRAMEVVAEAQARSAADLGALAGAARAALGAEQACERAGGIVTANEATMTSCHLEGLEITITATVRGRWATARAGPVRVDG